MTRWCYIDGCRNEATLIVESYPDDITLCDDHRWIQEDPEPCPMGCGRTTDDVAGGPCTTCWNEVTS